MSDRRSCGNCFAHKVALAEATEDSSFTQYAPDKLISIKAYDSDNIDQQLLKDRGVKLIAPHRMC